MQANTFQVGDRVQLIPFKHKGKVATVKFFGPIAKKFGTWVGLELDEPTGENSGEINGEQIFECQPDHGVILRNTQVKICGEESIPVRPRPTAVTKIDAGLDDDKDGLGDSPLITPRKGDDADEAPSRSTAAASASDLMQKMTQAIQNPAAFKARAATTAEEDTKKRGWQERLEQLKQKKQEQKLRQKAEETAKLTQPPSEEERVRDSFATQGITRTADGDLQVARTEVKKGPTGEEIMKQAVEEAKNEKVTPVKQPSTRSSLASINKLMQPSPAKTPGDKTGPTSSRLGGGTSGTTAAASRLTGRTGVQTAKQQELAAKKEEMERQRKARQTQATTGRVAGSRLGTTGASTASGATSARGTTGRISARPGVTGTATPGRSTIGKAVGAKAEEEKKMGGVRRPAMTSTNTKPTVTRSGSSLRGSSNTRSTIGGGQPPVSPKRTSARPTGETPMKSVSGKVPVASSRLSTGVRDRTPGPAAGTIAKATPMEIRKMENTIKDKEAENTRLLTQIKNLQSEKTTLTKEKAEKEAQATKATKEKKDLMTKAEKEKQEVTEKATREKETIKKEFQAKISSMQNQIQSQQEENQQLQESQDMSQEKSTIQEEAEIKVVQLEGTLEELNIKLAAQEQSIQESQQQVLEAEIKQTEMDIKTAESEQKIKDQEAKITETESQLSQREKDHEARMADMELQLKKSQEEIAESAAVSYADTKDRYKKIEEEIAAKFMETQKEFQKNLEAAQEAEKKAGEAEKSFKVKYEEEMARRVDEGEIHELEMQTIQDEKRDLMDKIMEQGKVEEEDPLKDLSLEEIKLQNKKLRQAITSLTFGFEEEKRKLENQMKNETGKDKIIAEQEKRLEEMDFLLEEVERKEQERAEMEEKLEEIVEYENMVEEMVQEIANREEENEDLLERINELEEEEMLLDELNQGLELDNTEMQEDLAEKERELTAAKNEIDQLEGIVIDQDGITTKYKDRQQEFQKQIKVLSEQLSETINSDNKDQVSLLLEKQQQLIARLRDAEKKSLQITKSQITMQQERMGIEVVQNMLPDSLMNEALLPCLKKIQGLNFVKHKSMMLLREICETQVDNASQIYQDLSQLNSFYEVLLRMSMLANRIVQSGHRICYFVANMSPGQYAEITRLLAWDQHGDICEEIDSLLDLLKEENLPYNYNCDILEHKAKQIEQLQSTVEKSFTSLSPEEAKTREGYPPTAPDPETLTARKALLQSVPKLSLRDQVQTMAVGVIFVPRMATLYASELERRQVIQKVSLIYWRLVDIVLKLDNIDNVATGQEYLSEDTSNTDLRLEQKYQTIKVLWDGNSNQKQEASQKSWSSVLEAIERDVTSLGNDFKFKQLSEKVEEKYGSGKVDYNDLYNVDYQSNGPWRVVSEQVKSELQDMGALKQKNSNLLEKQKEMLKTFASMKKEKDESVFITQTLKGQLSQAVAKADQVPALEIEKKDLKEKINTLEKRLDSANKDVTTSRASIDNFKVELKKAKEAQESASQVAEQEMIMGSSRQGLRRGNAIKARTGATKHRSRESGAAFYFQKMQMAGMASDQTRTSGSHQRGQSMANNQQMLAQAQMSEDIYMETINQLQADRMRLRGKDMLQRLQNLHNSEGAFAQVTVQLRDAQKKKEMETTQGFSVKLNKAEQVKVKSALESVETLKFKVKKQMACRRIVDLTKTTPAASSAAPQPEEAKTNEPHPNETFNYMVMETREKINDAMQILFSKDSKLRKLHGHQAATVVPTATEVAAPPEQQPDATKLNHVKIGALQLRSKVRVPQNRVILDESALSELRRNVALFAAN